MSLQNAREIIQQTLSALPGVETKPHRFGGLEFALGKRELGHIHGNRQVDIPFPVKIREELVAAGTAERHHILPDSGWVSFYLREDADIQKATELLERSYALALQQKARRTARHQKLSQPQGGNYDNV